MMLAAAMCFVPGWQAAAQWQTIGTGVYHEDLIPDFDGTCERGMKWNVTIEENTETPGLYRFVPYHKYSGIAEWITASDDVTCMIIHAENPDKVWMEDFKPYPEYEMFWFTHMVPESGWEAEPAGYGILSEGVISFPASCMAFVNIYDENQQWFATNTSGSFKIELPGGESYEDYSLFLENPYCGADNSVPVTITCGNSTASMKYAIYKGPKEADAQLAADIAANGTLIEKGEQSIKCPAHGMYTLVVVTLDNNGNLKEYKKTEIYGLYDNDDDWKSLGKTTYHEAIIAEHYEYDYTDLQVEIQENIHTPGYYRLVNPYAEYEYNYIERVDGHNHYMYIHAENPKAVWIENSPLGADFGYGDGRISSVVAQAIENGFTLQEALDSGLEVGFINNENAIVFPEWGIKYADRDYFDGEWYSSGLGFKLQLPDNAGIDSIISQDDNTPVQYYNMQGIKLNSKPSGIMYIEKHGSTVTKHIN